MNKEELWQALIERYPEFADPEFVVKQRSRGLRRLLDQAWDEGAASVSRVDTKPKNPFEGLFGKR